MSQRNYLSAADTAALIRQCLKEAFPGVKFSVRKSPSSSINIGWVDGPNEAQVSALVDVFKGKYFDGMIDYAGSCYAILDGQQVHFGADYIFYNRSYSDEAIARAVQVIKSQRWVSAAESEQITVDAFNRGDLYRLGNGPFGVQSLIHQRLSKVSQYPNPQQSATRARVDFAGDDGYGRGTVGDLTKPEAERVTEAGYHRPEPKPAQPAMPIEQVRAFLLSLLAPESAPRLVANNVIPFPSSRTVQ